MATKPKALSFALTCPHCHDADAVVSLDLNDLAECRCAGCDESFSPQQARDMAAAELAKWDRVLRWISLAGEVLASDQP